MTLVHHMGGVIRKDFNSKVTHLVANSTQGEKFRVCTAWVFLCILVCYGFGICLIRTLFYFS